VALAALLAGCAGEDATGIVVEVSTDLVAPAQADVIEVVVTNEAGGELKKLRFDLCGDGPARPPGRLGLTPQDPGQGSAITVLARALRGRDEVVSRRATLRFQRGAVVLLPMALLAGCQRHPCRPGEETCAEGPTCVPIAVKVESLRRYQPRADGAAPAPCSSATDGSIEAPAPGDGAPTISADAARDATADAGAPGGSPEAGADRASAADGPTMGADAALVSPPTDVRPPDPPDAAVPVDSPPLLPDAPAPLPDAPAPMPDAPAPMPDAPAPVPDAPAPSPDVALATGAPCTTSTQCASRACVDDVCCESACPGTCRACAGVKTGGEDGRCLPVSAGRDPDDECGTDMPTTCNYDGLCDGAGACRLYGPSTRCDQPACNDNVYTPARFCTGAGACGPPAPRGCGFYTCSLDDCLTSCQDDQQCAGAGYCEGGSCVERKPALGTCNRPRVCQTNVCQLGLCL
jgi:hypothetical protein